MAKKKQSVKSEVVYPDKFILLGADLSLNRPGFCVLQYDKGKIAVRKIFSNDNKTKPSKKQRAEVLYEIGELLIQEFSSYNMPYYCVREASINNARFGKRSGTAARTGISEVVGVADITLWASNRSTWDEIYPTSIKKLTTGSGKATKEEVAEATERYIGKQDYKNDDESDAAAVAISWFIKNNFINTIPKDTATGVAVIKK